MKVSKLSLQEVRNITRALPLSNLQKCMLDSSWDNDPVYKDVPRVYGELVAVEVGVVETMGCFFYDLPNGNLFIWFFDGFGVAGTEVSPFTCVEIEKNEFSKYGVNV